MEDFNTREYLEGMRCVVILLRKYPILTAHPSLAHRTKIIDNLKSLPFAPSVQMQEVPRTALVGEEAKLSDDEDSDLDRRISHRMRDRHIDRYGDEMSDEEEDDSDTPMADARPSMMARSGSQAAAFVLASGGRNMNGLQAAPSTARPRQNGSAALGHDLASSYLVDRGAGEDGDADGSRLLDALGSRRGGKRQKRSFFAGRASASTNAIAGAAQDLAAAQAAAYYAAASSALDPRSVSVTAESPVPSQSQLASWSAGLNGKRRAPGANGRGPGIWDGELIESDADGEGSGMENGRGSSVKSSKTFQRVGTGLALAEQRQREMAGAA